MSNNSNSNNATLKYTVTQESESVTVALQTNANYSPTYGAIFKLGSQGTFSANGFNITLNSNLVVEGSNTSKCFMNVSDSNQDYTQSSLSQITVPVGQGQPLTIGTADAQVQSTKYVLNTPYVVVNGCSTITFEEFISLFNLPSDVTPNKTLIGSNLLQDNAFNNIANFLNSLYQKGEQYSEVGLINALTSQSSNNQPVSIGNINVRSENITITFGQTGSNVYDMTTSDGFITLGQFLNTSFWAGTGSNTYQDTAVNFISQLDVTNGQNYNNFWSALNGYTSSQNSGNGMLVFDINNTNVEPQTYFSSLGVDNIGNSIISNFASNMTNKYVPLIGGNNWVGYFDYDNFNYSDFTNSSWYSYVTNAQNHYANSGNVLFQSYGYSVNVIPVGFSCLVSEQSFTSSATTLGDAILLYIQGTYQVGDWGTHLLGNNQFFTSPTGVTSNNWLGPWGLSVSIRNQFPYIGIQQIVFSQNYVQGSPFSLIFNSGTQPSTLTIPVVYVNIINPSNSNQVEVSGDVESIDNLINKYKHISKVLSSHLLSIHNIKLFFAGNGTIVGGQPNSVFSAYLSSTSSSASLASQFYSYLLMTAIENGSGINTLTSLFSQYPFSSIPMSVHSLIVQLNTANKTSLSITPNQLNYAIYSFYTSPSPTKVTSTSSTTQTFSTQPDPDPALIKYVMNSVDSGLALLEFTKSAIQFTKSIDGISSSNSSALLAQWNSITSSWNKSGLSNTSESSHPYTFHSSVDDILSSIASDIGSINDLVSKNLTLEGNKANFQIELRQILANQHGKRTNALQLLLTSLGDDMLSFNPWKEIGDLTLSIPIGVADVAFSIVKFVADLTVSILTGVSKICSPGGLIEQIYTDTSIVLTNPVSNYTDISGNLFNSIVFNDKYSGQYNPFMLPLFTNCTLNSGDNGYLNLTYNGVTVLSSIQPNAITKYVVNTPVGKVNLLIDSVNSFGNFNTSNGVSTVEPVSNNMVPGVYAYVDPSVRTDGHVDVLKSLYRTVKMYQYLPILFTNLNVSSFQESPYFQSFETLFFSKPGVNNMTQHMSVGEFVAVSSVSAASAAAWLYKATGSGFDFNFASATGDLIMSAESLTALAECAIQFSSDEATNIADVFNQNMGTFLPNISSFTADFSSSNLSSFDLIKSPYVVHAYTSIISGNAPTPSTVAGPSYSPDVQSELELISISIGKFAIGNYAQHSLWRHLTKHIHSQAKYDAMSSRVESCSTNTNGVTTVGNNSYKGTIAKILFNKYHRVINSDHRRKLINSQTQSLTSNLMSSVNGIQSSISDTTSSILDSFSSLRGIN